VHDLASEPDRYLVIGVFFIPIGTLIAAYCYWVIQSIPFTALGLALIILGFSVGLIPQSPVPTDVVRRMVEGVCANVDMELEEFDAHEKAWYLPPRDGRVFCFVPLVANVEPAAIWAASRAPMRILASPMGVPGLMVFPPGSEILRLSQLEGGARLEEAMNYVLVDYFEGAESVKVVKEGSRVKVFIGKARLRSDFSRFNSVLGSITVSVLGCVAAQVLMAPVSVVEERNEGNNVRAIFTVLAAG
jgi:hypothetical protein